MKPIRLRWPSWLMLRKNGLWQHSGAIEQIYRLTGKIFGRAVTVVIRVSSI
jgi:hypothetical protein